MPGRKVEDSILIENARIIFRNFRGLPGKFNAEGDRNFSVILDEELAQRLINEGWNVKRLRAREEGETPQAHLPVKVNFRGKPPKIVMISSRGRTEIGEDMVDLLDFAEMDTVDLIVNPYNWEVGGKGGVKAYLKSIFVTIIEDELDLKYAGVEDARVHSEN